MKKISLSRLFAGLLVALFLIAPVLSGFAGAPSDYKKSRDYVLTSMPATHSTADNLLSFEEKEKEERSDDSQSLILVCFLNDFTSLHTSGFHYSWSIAPSRYVDITPSIPLYLSKRTLLI